MTAWFEILSLCGAVSRCHATLHTTMCQGYWAHATPQQNSQNWSQRDTGPAPLSRHVERSWNTVPHHDKISNHFEIFRTLCHFTHVAAMCDMVWRSVWYGVSRCGHGVTPRHAVCQPPLRMLSLGVQQRSPFAAYICSKSVQSQLKARSSQVDRARGNLLWPILTLPASYSGGRAFKPVSREVKVSFTISTWRQ